MKEEEARTKWCPMVRFYANREVLTKKGFTDGRLDYDSNCIASDCMMWVATDNEGYPSTNKHGECDNSAYYPAGYCGLIRNNY